MFSAGSEKTNGTPLVLNEGSEKSKQAAELMLAWLLLMFNQPLGLDVWQPAGVFTQARGIVLSGLTPGNTYSVQARGIGGSTGYSDWSDPVSHMAM